MALISSQETLKDITTTTRLCYLNLGLPPLVIQCYMINTPHMLIKAYKNTPHAYTYKIHIWVNKHTNARTCTLTHNHIDELKST